MSKLFFFLAAGMAADGVAAERNPPRKRFSMNDKAADETVRTAALSCPPAVCCGTLLRQSGETDATSLKSGRKPASSSGPSAYDDAYGGIGGEMQAFMLQCSIASAVYLLIHEGRTANVIAQAIADLRTGSIPGENHKRNAGLTICRRWLQGSAETDGRLAVPLLQLSGMQPSVSPRRSNRAPVGE